MPQNLTYDESTGKYYDEAGNELTIADGAPVPTGAQGEPAAPGPEQAGPAPGPEQAGTPETPTTVTTPDQPATGEATQPAQESSSSDGQLLDVEGVPQLARARFTEKEATDTEPAEYREETGNVVVGTDGALRFQKLETQEGGQA